MAHPPSALYYARKLFSRNLATSVFLIAAIGLVAAFAVELSNHAIEMQRLEDIMAERDRAARVNDVLQESSAQRLEDLAGRFSADGQYSPAVDVLRVCLAIRRSAHGSGDWMVAHTEALLGHCLTELGRYQEAETLLLRSAESLQRELGEQDQNTRSAQRQLIALYTAWNRPDEAEHWRAVLESTKPPRRVETERACGRSAHQRSVGIPVQPMRPEPPRTRNRPR